MAGHWHPRGAPPWVPGASLALGRTCPLAPGVTRAWAWLKAVPGKQCLAPACPNRHHSAPSLPASPTGFFLHVGSASAAGAGGPARLSSPTFQASNSCSVSPAGTPHHSPCGHGGGGGQGPRGDPPHGAGAALGPLLGMGSGFLGVVWWHLHCLLGALSSSSPTFVSIP